MYLVKLSDMSSPPKTFISTLILELRGIKLDKTWTHGSPQHKEQVPKEVFPKSKDFPSDFEELENLGFGGTGRNPPN
jgi:hypothetical protein